ncbi:MAG: 50S ribosomal protein L6 [Flavobacteriales bacterium]|jgi:large subunit ribosomal protein L6|nr:50S ribosomal protein L6 [Flavobacteriales bacterium]
MSRIGMKPIEIPDNVQIVIEGKDVMVSGPKGKLKKTINNLISVEKKENTINVTKSKKTRTAQQLWGLTRSLIANMVKGVSEGFTKVLEVKGVGYKVSVKNNIMTLNLGYSHEIKYFIPEDVTIKCPKPTLIEVSSHNNELLGQVGADLRDMRPPEPYKGKGIKYKGEYILIKEGKK